MAVQEADVAVGKCFVTANSQVRRVLSLTDGKVAYEARGKRALPGTWPDRAKPKMSTFLASVEREVSCDYDPDVGTGQR